MTIALNGRAAADTEALLALRVIESMPGFAWSADAAGKFTYVSANTLAFLGGAREDLDPLEGEDEFGWRRVVHPDDYDHVAARWRHCLRTGERYDTEHRLRRADGVYRWFRNSGRPSHDDQGRITAWHGTTIDIDDQKQAEAALLDRERELSQLVDMVPSHLWRLTPDGEPIFFSKRMVDFLGLDVVDFDKPGVSRLEALLETIHPDETAEFNDRLSRCLKTGESFEMRYRLRRIDGVYRWMSSRAEPMRDQSGRIAQWYGLCHDIDDQVRAEEALRRSERQLQQLVDAVPANLWSTAGDGTPTYRNKRHTRSTGATLSDLTAPDGSSSPLATLAHPDDRASAQQVRSRAFETGSTYVVRYRQIRSDGTYRWTESRAEPLRDETGEIVQWYGVSVDIHDLVTTQEVLRDRERELSQLVDMVPSFLWRLSPLGEPVFFSKRMVEFLGLDIGEYDKPGMSGLASAICTIVHPDDAARLEEALNRSFDTGESFSLNYRLRRADGVYRWMSGRGEPLRDENARVIQWYGLCHDIDDQIHAETALRQSEQSLRQLVETLPAMIDCAAPDGEPIYRSQQLREFLGYNLEDLDEAGTPRLAGTLDGGVHPDDLGGVREHYRHSLSTGEPYARKHRLRRFDGEYRWVETRAAAMRNSEGTIVQWNVICLDIDSEVRAQEELRLAQESLARASQAASLAELSASIAHEVNQPLAAIVANSYACHRWLSATPPNVERGKITAERIVRDANSAADVVSRIRALFRQAVEPRSSTALSSVLTEACNLMAEEASRRRIRMEVDVERTLPLIAFDRVQVQQVLINLIRNGMDAIDTAADDRVLKMRMRHVGDAVQTEISDCGPGIKFPDKIFEPFFTTKEHGMGMGLAICRSIVESHGGRLWVEENAPNGATFIFTLPTEMKAAT